MKHTHLLSVVCLLLLGLSRSAGADNAAPGTIRIDGSSTVYPITEAVAEEFGKEAREIKVTVGISGTGGGFKKFCGGETEISDASRPIKAAEAEACKAAKIEYIELAIAYDAITVVINPKNTWATSLTLADLKKMWEPDAQGKVMTWNNVRPEWPAQPLRLFGPGTDSGTFDYFTEAICGKEDASRGDFTGSEDDNVLVQGVAGDTGALGYFGLSYYVENAQRLKAVAIDSGNGAVSPTFETVLNGTYRPLSRPLFIYVRRDLAQRADVKQFVEFYLKNVKSLAREVGYVPLLDETYQLVQQRFAAQIGGSALGAHGSQLGVSMSDLLKSEQLPK